MYQLSNNKVTSRLNKGSPLIIDHFQNMNIIIVVEVGSETKGSHQKSNVSRKP